ncbi:hypothetical protein NPX13_g9613 [Xylaria arbuscula]|uniref:Uncharacterized protein n=1 Tax=Xylaria arbuscula TaxID=114810 RepID=A0A9W8N630_9PEZI|nr:hypothetical protein NPX13_g9613 [Xylaria arbuscula]
MAEPPRKRQRRRLNYDKCRFCRNAKKACTPVERIWPQKCQRCTELELECSENSRAAGASTVPPQPSHQVIDVGMILDMSLKAVWLTRLNAYHNATREVWHSQEMLFKGWRRELFVDEIYSCCFHTQIVSSSIEFFDMILESNHPMIALTAQAFLGPNPPQPNPDIKISPIMIDRFWKNGDLGTALAMQEMLLKSDEMIISTFTDELSRYCDILHDVVERLETIFSGKLLAVPPLHYCFYFLRTNNKQLPEFPQTWSRFLPMKDYFERSALHVALDLDLELSRAQLRQFPIFTTGGDAWGRQPIHITCASFLAREYILKQTSDCEVEDRLGRSALHYASSCGNYDGVHMLIERGTNIDHEDRDGKTPISWAIEKRHTYVVEVLIEHGAGSSTQDRYSPSALAEAAAEGNMEKVETILEHSGDSSYRDRFGIITALHLAARYGHCSTIKILLEHGAGVDEQNHEGQTALHLAALNGQEDAIEVLLSFKARIDEPSTGGETALYLAAATGHLKCVRALLRNGADVDERNDNGETALIIATKWKSTAIVQELVDHGATVNLKDNDGDSALSLASDNRSYGILEILFNGAS